MKDKEMDELTKLCDQLNSGFDAEKENINEIVYVKKALEEYVKNDKNKLLELKAEVRYHKEKSGLDLQHIAILISVYSFLISIMAICPYRDKSMVLGVLFLLFILIAVITIRGFNVKRDAWREMWENRIEVAIEDMEKQVSKKKKNK